MSFSRSSLLLDPIAEVERLADRIRCLLGNELHRRGVVVGLSGGIDSSVTAALAVRAIGKEKVFALLMPERDSSPDTLTLSTLVADFLGVDRAEEDITRILKAADFYKRYEKAVQTIIPGYGSGWKSKLISSEVRDNRGFTFFSIVAQSPLGEKVCCRLPLRPYLEIVAATNFKQRTRKMLEYYHADRLNFAVAGTPNRLEYDQGFFVKNGDGAADIKPIAHLYKCQVYQLAEYFQLPELIRARPPTTDTYALPQQQDEFFFGIPIEQLDICLFGKNHGFDAETVAQAAGLEVAVVRSVWRDVDRKRATTRPLHLPPLLLDFVPEIDFTSKNLAE